VRRPHSTLLDDDARRRAARSGGAGDFLPDAGGHPAEDNGVLVVGRGNRDWRSAVGGLADLAVERNLAEKLGAEPICFLARAAMRKDLAAVTESGVGSPPAQRWSATIWRLAKVRRSDCSRMI
jgi:hypothetical protein